MKYIVTDIQEQKKNKDRYSIFLNDNFYKGVSKYVIYKNSIKIGQQIDLEKLEKVIFEDEIEKAKSYIANYHSNKTEKIMREKLKNKEYDEKVIEATIEFMNKYNYINDDLYAENLKNDSVRIKKIGKGKIKQKLYEKGVSKEIIEKTLENIDPELERENIKFLIEKKYEYYNKKSKTKYELKNKLFTFLISKGYSIDDIKNVLDEYIK